MAEVAASAEPTAPLETPTPVASSDEEHHSRGRTVAVAVSVVLAALLTTPAAIAYWGQRTLNDTQRYVATVGPLVSSPEVQDVISATVTDAIQEQVDVEAILTNVFAEVIADRARLAQLVGPVAGAIDGMIESEVHDFVASDEFAAMWTRVNTRAQQALQRVLNGEGSGAVSLQGEQVVLDVNEVIDQVKQRLVDRGLTFVANAPVPQVEREIVLLDAPQLSQLRTIYAFGNPVATWLLPAVAALFVMGFVLARRRPRMTVVIGAVLAANALLLALAISLGRDVFVDQLAGSVFGPASTVFYDTLLTYLQRGQEVLLALGLILVVAGWFAGPNTYGTAVRTRLATSLEGVGARVARGSSRGAGEWVTANVSRVRVAVVLLGVVVLVWGNAVTLSRLGWSVALVLVLLAGAQVLVGAGRSLAGTPASQPVAPAVTLTDAGP